MGAIFDAGRYDPRHLQRYRDLIGSDSAHAPLTYFYLYAQRAQFALMLDRRFPHSVAGLIHVSNVLTQTAPIQANLAMQIDVLVKPVECTGRAPRFVFETWICQLEQKIISCVSEYQASGVDRDRPARSIMPTANATPLARENWEITPSAIRRYAQISGDYNPIHLSASIAKCLGFKAPIAHGMYLVARSAAVIERQTQQAVLEISARFRRPVYLPGELGFECSTSSSRHGDFTLEVVGAEPQLKTTGAWRTGFLKGCE